MSSGEDVVVRLAALSTLGLVIDDFGFRADGLGPHLATLMPLAFELLAAVEEYDTKMAVLSTVTLVVERVGAAHATA